MSTLLLVIGLLFSSQAWSYPEFIGYKYTSCLTCHYNGQGNGPINDYGRALWASEIAGKMFNKNKSDEALGEASGFLGKKPLPWWIRPGVKARGFYLMPNPGSPAATNRFILMQADANAAFFFDKDQKYTAVVSFGLYPDSPSGASNRKTTISREHYFRWQMNDKMWHYFGKMDKVYGIRTVNHTAFSRARVGLDQNSQSHGYIFHYVKEHLEATFNFFLGDFMDDTPDLRQKGFSAMVEYDPAEAWRVGASFLSSKSDSGVENRRIGVHSKQGFGEGSSLLLELGMITDTAANGTSKDGYYFFSQAMQRITRGYNIFVSGQGYKDEMVSSRPNNLKATIGLLMFPLQRYEFRIEAENTRQTTNSADFQDETWALMSQMHLSY